MRGYACIALVRPKTPANVGSVLRAAHCFGASLVVTSGHRYTRSPTDVTKAWRHIPFMHTDDVFGAVPYCCSPVAVDIIEDAKPLPLFQHPEQAFYIFGAEDETLRKDITSLCKHKVVIPTSYCLNLAAAVNVVLYDRVAKGMGCGSDYSQFGKELESA